MSKTSYFARSYMVVGLWRIKIVFKVADSNIIIAQSKLCHDDDLYVRKVGRTLKSLFSDWCLIKASSKISNDEWSLKQILIEIWFTMVNVHIWINCRRIRNVTLASFFFVIFFLGFGFCPPLVLCFFFLF